MVRLSGAFMYPAMSMSSGAFSNNEPSPTTLWFDVTFMAFPMVFFTLFSPGVLTTAPRPVDLMYRIAATINSTAIRIVIGSFFFISSSQEPVIQESQVRDERQGHGEDEYAKYNQYKSEDQVEPFQVRADGFYRFGCLRYEKPHQKERHSQTDGIHEHERERGSGLC